MNKFASLFAVKIEDVRTAAEKAIAKIQARRKDLFEKAVEKELNARFFRAKTREDAEKRARQNTSLPIWNISGWGTLGQAERLLAASSVCSEDMAYLSAEDAEFVHEWRDLENV